MAKRDLGDVAVTALTRPGIGSALLAALGVYIVLAARTLLGVVAFVLTDPTAGQDVGTYLSLFVRGALPTALKRASRSRSGCSCPSGRSHRWQRSCGWRTW